MLPAILFAFSSASSVGDTAAESGMRAEAGGEEGCVCAALGATINMDGTAFIRAQASFSLRPAFGADLTIGQQLTIISPDGNTGIHQGQRRAWGRDDQALAMVLQSVGLPERDCACGKRDRLYF